MTEIRKVRKAISPYIKILASFLLVILIGTVLLLLPISIANGAERLTFVESFFMSTSAVCVTGLSVVSNVGMHFSVFGKIVLMILMEFGGLSFLTITVFIFIVIGKKIMIADRFLMKEALNLNSSAGIVKLVKKIILVTISIQTVGAILFFFRFIKDYEFGEAVLISFFHAVSSFNNSGFDIFRTSGSMMLYQSDIYINIITMILIIIGGIGFVVIIDVFENKHWKKLNLHTKIVLVSTTTLIVVGTLLLKLAMKNITFLEAMFQSVSARTAGFATIDISTVSNAGFLVLLALMFIGASPCSTGGGIKTTTMFVIMVTLIGYAKGKDINVFHRRIANQVKFKAYTLIAFSIIFVMIMAIIVSFIQPNLEMKALIFEVVSAFGTVGLSMGITTSLAPLTQLAICLTMFAGRLGPLTLISVWNSRWMSDTIDAVRYPEEKIIIG